MPRVELTADFIVAVDEELCGEGGGHITLELGNAVRQMQSVLKIVHRTGRLPVQHLNKFRLRFRQHKVIARDAITPQHIRDRGDKLRRIEAVVDCVHDGSS